MFDSCWGHFFKFYMSQKPENENMKYLAIVVCLILLPLGMAFADDDPAPVAAKTEPAAPKSELDTLKAEWEAVREQQVQMIREKEDQLEKLKEEIFAKLKSSDISAASQSKTVKPADSNMPGPILPADNSGVTSLKSSPELEAQKAAFQAERQKFFAEMSRQKESLLQLQASLDKKTKQLEADRERFEKEKKTAAA